MINLSEAEVKTMLINDQILSMYRIDDTTKKEISLLTFQDSDLAKKILKGHTTHDLKVHISSSKSALRLLRRYGDTQIEANLHAFISIIAKTSHRYKKYAFKYICRCCIEYLNYAITFINLHGDM